MVWAGGIDFQWPPSSLRGQRRITVMHSRGRASISLGIRAISTAGIMQGPPTGAVPGVVYLADMVVYQCTGSTIAHAIAD